MHISPSVHTGDVLFNGHDLFFKHLGAVISNVVLCYSNCLLSMPLPPSNQMQVHWLLWVFFLICKNFFCLLSLFKTSHSEQVQASPDQNIWSTLLSSISSISFTLRWRTGAEFFPQKSRNSTGVYISSM